MTDVNPSQQVARLARALEGSRGLEAARQRTSEAWERRLVAEVSLEGCYRDLARVTGWGIATWWPRLISRIGDRQQYAQEALRRQEVETGRAITEHQDAVRSLSSAQAGADDLPAAREAAVAAMKGPESEAALQALEEARELAEALFAANNARLAATGVDDELSAANWWSTYDTYFGGALVSSAMKDESLQYANAAAAPLVERLTILRKELQDLEVPTSYFAVQTNDMTARADIWWDNVFSDLVMAKRIHTARERLQRLQDGLTELALILGERRNLALARVDDLIAESFAEHGA